MINIDDDIDHRAEVLGEPEINFVVFKSLTLDLPNDYVYKRVFSKINHLP